MARVALKPHMLHWALERSGRSVDTLAHRFPKIREWESEKTRPTLKQLENFAHATHTPLGYLLLPEPPLEELPIPDFRTVQDAPVRRPSPELIDTIQTMERRQSWMREFLRDIGFEPLHFIASRTTSSPITEVASDMRKTLGLPPEWAQENQTWGDALRTLRAAIEASGVLVAINSIVGNNTHRPLLVSEFRGFVLLDDVAPLIFVNGSDAKAAQMFTLAHELAHLWVGASAVFNLDGTLPPADDVERFCNWVAAEFLIPIEQMRRAWPLVAHDDEPFHALARRFKVSPIVAARRALDVGFIERPVFFQFYKSYSEDERSVQARRRSGGGDFYVLQDMRIGRRFGRAVVSAAREGRLLYSVAYELIGLSGATFDRYAKALGFGGRGAG